MKVTNLILLISLVVVGAVVCALFVAREERVEEYLTQTNIELQNVKSAISLQTEKEIKIRKMRNFILEFNPFIVEEVAFELASVTYELSIKYPSVDPFDIIALGYAESRFKIKAVSKDGALGWLQVMPYNLKLLCRAMNWSYSDTMHYADIKKYTELAFVHVDIIQSDYSGEDRWVCYNAGPKRVGKPLLEETKILLKNFNFAAEELLTMEI